MARPALRRLLAVATVAALALPAAAAGKVELKRLDANGYPTVRAVVVTSKPTASAPVMRENGARVSGLLAQNLGSTRNVVLAIDRSRSMSGQSFDDAIAAARAFIATKHPGDRIAVVSFGSEAIKLTGFSTASIDADGALRSLTVEQREGTALYDAIRLSSQALRTQPAGARVIILLTDGRDVSSKATLAQAVAAARVARAAVYPIGIEGEQFSPDPLHRIANQTGGSYRGVVLTAALPRVYAEIARELRRTWRVEYVTAGRPGDRLHLQASVAGQGTVLGTIRISPDAGPSAQVDDSTGVLPDKLATSTWAHLLFALLIGLLVLLAVRFVLARPRGSWARARVAPHVEPVGGGATEEPAKKTPSASLAGLYRVTEERLGSQRTWGRIEHLLERADLPLRTPEFVYLSAACGVILGLLFIIVGLPVWAAVAALAAGALVPTMFARFRARKRIDAFEAQLPDLLITLASSLRAGHSLRQAIRAIVEEGHEPAKKEFGRVLTEASLGRPMEEALADMARRLDSEDFDYVVTAVTIQRQVGGALAGLFDLVADTVRGRQQFHRKIRSLTAMGRMSALILIVLPFLVAVALTAMNPDYMDPLYHSSTGHTLIAIGLVGMVVGSLFLRRIVQFRG
jgi:tight adherence protein B